MRLGTQTAGTQTAGTQTANRRPQQGAARGPAKSIPLRPSGIMDWYKIKDTQQATAPSQTSSPEQPPRPAEARQAAAPSLTSSPEPMVGKQPPPALQVQEEPQPNPQVEPRWQMPTILGRPGSRLEPDLPTSQPPPILPALQQQQWQQPEP